jgi:hypothetical protein
VTPADLPLSLIVLLLGSVTYIVCSSLAGTRVWPVLLYWIGWTTGIYAAETLSGDSIMPVFTDTNRDLLIRLHAGAAVGFVVACLFFHVGNGAFATGTRERLRRDERLLLSPRLVGVAFLLQLGFGALLLMTRLQTLGGISASTIMADIRNSYLLDTGLGANFSPMVRLGSHLANFLVLFPFLFGVQDGLERRVQSRRILLWWLASIPGGISTGGRGWIVTAPLVYAISFVVTSAETFDWRRTRKLLVRGAPAVLVLALLFSAVEKSRRTNDVLGELHSAGWYQKAPAAKALVYYLGLPILAVDSYTEYAAAEKPFNGALTFEFFSAQWNRLTGVGGSTASDFNVASRTAMFFGPYPILFATHVPVIPNLVADFGMPAFPYVFSLICFAAILAYLLLWRRGIVGRFTAVTIALVFFWTFQSLMLGSAGMLLPIGWLLALVAVDAALRRVGVHARPWIDLSPSL